MGASQRVSRALTLLAVSLFLLAVLTGCDNPGPVVVMDDWWNVDYMKGACAAADKWHQEHAELIAQAGCDSVTACPQMMPLVEGCTPDPIINLSAFETDLEAQFAANPQCKGVQFVRFSGPDNTDTNASDAMQREHWALSLNYDPGAGKQAWAMNHDAAVTSGTGDPKEIVESVCSIVTERGAKLLN
jgi:hypothetical protein